MADAAIQIENLTKDYPFGFLHLKKKRSLEGLTMQVEDGEVFGFLGPNGAGKSTTIKLLVGLIFPTAGTAQILGKPISDIAMHQDIGYLPEQPYFYDYLTAAELLDYFARIPQLEGGGPARARGAHAEESRPGDGAENSAAKILEGNAAARRIGASDPARSEGGDSGRADVGARSAWAGGKCATLFWSLKREGRTVLFSTHILSDAEMLCDRVGVIVGGKLRGVGAPDEIVGIKAHGMEILFERTGDAAGAAVGAFGKSDANGKPIPDACGRRPSCTRRSRQLREAGARILSVTQMKASLEEYFMHLIEADRAQAAAVDVSGK